MGDSSTQNEETTVGYNPCYYFQLVARGVLKCLGLDSGSTQRAEKINETSYEDNSSPSTEEQGMKSNNEDVEAMFSYSEITLIRRAPPRPSVGTGRPPGINFDLL